MAASPGGGRPTSDVLHRRETIRYIVLPMVAVGALVLVGVVVVLLLPGQLQVGLIADWLFTILFLCPLVLCLFPLCILLIAAVVGMSKANQLAANPLRRLEALSASLRDRTVHVTDALNRRVVSVSARWAFVDRLLAVFDPPIPSPDALTKEEHDGESHSGQ